MVIAQKWAERKRRILVITPASLRKQWLLEMQDKFFLPGKILETKTYKEAKKRAFTIHLMTRSILSSALISLLRVKSKKSQALSRIWWLLMKLIDCAMSIEMLRQRLKPICHRTLRKQVDAYVPFTARRPLLFEFEPETSEEYLYALVSNYLQRDDLKALPSGQRPLITLMLRKLLASSTFAIAGALSNISKRLQAELNEASTSPTAQLTLALEDDYEGLSQIEEEWNEDLDSIPDEPAISETEKAAIEAEIAELREFAKIAISIQENGKGRALLDTLQRAFDEVTKLGGAQKAIIFTEFRKTQDYLLQLLGQTPWYDDILLFNGTNNDGKSKQIYQEWIARYKGTDLVTGSRSADMRAALVDYFRHQGKIMIATEAGAEGINLQFCSLIINYDLPWNPQRIEQRIGRCHRYGQKHDVVVVNFLNKKNEADQRVYELLSQKFKLFEGVFGSSDEVLGAIGSGVDFEKRIAQIYQECRKPEERKAAFDALQQELSSEIKQTMTLTQQKVIENFDDEVRQTLNTQAIAGGGKHSLLQG